LHPGTSAGMTKPRRYTVLCSAAGAAPFVLLPAVAQAQNIVVDTNADTSSSACTLRDAIDSANLDSNAGNPHCLAGDGGLDTITIQSSLSGSTLTLGTELPQLTTAIDITGPVGGFTIDANHQGFTVFTATASGDVSLSNLTLTGGYRHNVHGATGLGITNAGTLTLDHSSVTGNYAKQFGLDTTAYAHGVGIYNTGDLTLTDSSVTDNLAATYAVAEGVGIDSPAGSVALNGSTISGNHVRMFGGGSYVYGVGVNVGDGSGTGTMIATGSTISGNYTYTTAFSAAFYGGGISNRAGDVTLDGTTVSGNTVDATVNGGPTSKSLAAGGGIFAGSSGATTTLRSSTVTGNSAVAANGVSQTYAQGDQIGTSYRPGFPSGPYDVGLTVSASTVDAGTTGIDGDQIAGPFDLTLKSSILSALPGTGSDCTALQSVTTQGFNFDSDGSCIPSGSALATDQRGSPTPIDPQLGPLQDNGGPTETQAIPNTSPAIDKGISIEPTPTTDQRGTGFPRPADVGQVTDADGGDGADVGAYEYEPEADLSVTESDSADPVHVGDQILYTVTVRNSGPDSAVATALQDTLPLGTGFLSAPSPCGLPASGVVSCNFGLFASGATPQVQVAVQANSPGTRANHVSVSSSTPDPVPANNLDSESTKVLANSTPSPIPPSTGPNSQCDVTLRAKLKKKLKKAKSKRAKAKLRKKLRRLRC
jgi:uncharacterized repeat protein (TIGR01451 family)